jgi:hypothetical protein
MVHLKGLSFHFWNSFITIKALEKFYIVKLTSFSTLDRMARFVSFLILLLSKCHVMEHVVVDTSVRSPGFIKMVSLLSLSLQ